MNRILALFTLASFFLGSAPMPAQDAAMESRLARGLKLFPDADANRDGKLSFEEAMKYVAAHPELRALIGSKIAGDDASARAWSKPAGTASSTASTLSAGPRVFVCAHSFMIYTAMLLPPVAEAAGIAYQDAGRQMIGGSRVIQHWNLPDEKNRAKAALREGKVDVLTVSPHMLLPDEGIDKFTALGIEANPKLRVLVQASWPARDGVMEKSFANAKRDESTVESLQRMRESFHSMWLKPLEAQVRTLNTSIGRDAVFIVPVSEAVFALRECVAKGEAPGLTRQTELFRDDLGHPLAPLATLVTYCHFATIYGRSPEGLGVPAELKSHPQAAQLNSLLQRLAWEAVTHYPMSGVKPVGAE